MTIVNKTNPTESLLHHTGSYSQSNAPRPYVRCYNCIAFSVNSITWQGEK